MKWIAGALFALIMLVVILFVADIFSGATPVAQPATTSGSALAVLLFIAVVLVIIGILVPKDKVKSLPAVLFMGAAVILLFAFAFSGVGRWVGGTITKFETCLESPYKPECRQPVQTACPEDEIKILPGETVSYSLRVNCYNPILTRLNAGGTIETIMDGNNGPQEHDWTILDPPVYVGTLKYAEMTNTGDTPVKVWFGYR